MKRLGIVVTVVCIVSFAATASASASSYAGSVEPSGTISFDVRRDGPNQAILNLSWTRLPVDCRGTADTSSGNLSFAFPVVNESFKAEAMLGKNPKHPKARATITGKLAGRGARGSISVAGSKLPVDSGGRAGCHSGRLKWTATK